MCTILPVGFQDLRPVAGEKNRNKHDFAAERWRPVSNIIRISYDEVTNIHGYDMPPSIIDIPSCFDQALVAE